MARFERSVSHARLSVTALLSAGGVSNARSRTCVRIVWMRSGGSKPKRASTSCVSSLICPSRAGTNSRSPSAFRSAAYAIADTIESVSGLR